MDFQQLNDIRFIAAHRYKAKESGIFSTPECYFLFKLDGSVKYFYNGTTFISSPGDVIFFPKLISFRTEMIEPGEYILIYFSCPEDLGKEIQVFPRSEQADLSKLFISAAARWSLRDESSYFMCQAKLYEIVGRLSAEVKMSYLPLAERRMLSAPVDYMKAHLYEPGFSLKEMCRLSGVSSTQFRNVFSKMYGMPPKRYVLTSRINRAAQLFMADPFLRVQEVAEAVGYTDPFHFSKVFKKELGVSPSEYSKQY